ncbi:MAG: family 1 glycosylhydrolase, partial [bacterium]
MKFPKGFLWGSATSAYQVEGGIENNDWAKAFPAGKACDHYNRYEEDFELAKQLNQNAHRFSIEWSRIEPEEGVFDKAEIEHYRSVLQSLRKNKMKSMVTLHHFTIPLWLAEKGGWANVRTPFYFSRFAEKVFREYHDLVDFWITINEPTNYATIGYLQGRWVPNK